MFESYGVYDKLKWSLALSQYVQHIYKCLHVSTVSDIPTTLSETGK